MGGSWWGCPLLPPSLGHSMQHPANVQGHGLERGQQQQQGPNIVNHGCVTQ